MPTSLLRRLGAALAIATAIAVGLAGSVSAPPAARAAAARAAPPTARAAPPTARATADPAAPPAAPPGTTTPPTTPPIPVQVGTTAVGRPIPPGFLGFSFEYRAVRDYTGPNPRAINPVLVQLIRDLNPNQSPVLRIGGNSADESWWPTPGVKRSRGIKYTLNRSWLATTRALAMQTGGRLILDLNLKLDNAAAMTAEAQAFATGIGAGNIAALEIGNEPELYPITPFYYAGANKTPVYPRPRHYNPRPYLREIAAFAKQIKGFDFAGPATGSLFWLARVGKLFAAEPGLKVVTYHRYPLIRCFTKPGDPGYPTIPHLLSATASRSLLNGAAPYIAFAHRRGATFRVDELNSVACKGQPGVSDTFASSLWMLDTLFAMARSGVDGVNIHTLPEAVYHPFTFERVNGHWLAAVKPEYYGMLLFAQAAPPGSRLLTVSTPSDTGDLCARAALTPTGLVHVILINDSLTTDHTVTLAAPAKAGQSAVVERLSASGADATDGVTLGGQSFGTETGTGTLTGPFQVEHLTPTGGQYTIQLPASSAAMVSFAPPHSTG
jgi:Glycosyl hydrolase family 79 C-terminal beta domain